MNSKVISSAETVTLQVSPTPDLIEGEMQTKVNSTFIKQTLAMESEKDHNISLQRPNLVEEENPNSQLLLQPKSQQNLSLIQPITLVEPTKHTLIVEKIAKDTSKAEAIIESQHLIREKDDDIMTQQPTNLLSFPTTESSSQPPVKLIQENVFETIRESNLLQNRSIIIPATITTEPILLRHTSSPLLESINYDFNNKFDDLAHFANFEPEINEHNMQIEQPSMLALNQELVSQENNNEQSQQQSSNNQCAISENKQVEIVKSTEVEEVSKIAIEIVITAAPSEMEVEVEPQPELEQVVKESQNNLANSLPNLEQHSIDSAAPTNKNNFDCQNSVNEYEITNNKCAFPLFSPPVPPNNNFLLKQQQQQSMQQAQQQQLPYPKQSILKESSSFQTHTPLSTPPSPMPSYPFSMFQSRNASQISISKHSIKLSPAKESEMKTTPPPPTPPLKKVRLSDLLRQTNPVVSCTSFRSKKVHSVWQTKKDVPIKQQSLFPLQNVQPVLSQQAQTYNPSPVQLRTVNRSQLNYAPDFSENQDQIRRSSSPERQIDKESESKQRSHENPQNDRRVTFTDEIIYILPISQIEFEQLKDYNESDQQSFKEDQHVKDPVEFEEEDNVELSRRFTNKVSSDIVKETHYEPSEKEKSKPETIVSAQITDLITESNISEKQIDQKEQEEKGEMEQEEQEEEQKIESDSIEIKENTDNSEINAESSQKDDDQQSVIHSDIQIETEEVGGMKENMTSIIQETKLYEIVSPDSPVIEKVDSPIVDDESSDENSKKDNSHNSEEEVEEVAVKEEEKAHKINPETIELKTNNEAHQAENVKEKKKESVQLTESDIPLIVFDLKEFFNLKKRKQNNPILTSPIQKSPLKQYQTGSASKATNETTTSTPTSTQTPSKPINNVPKLDPKSIFLAKRKTPAASKKSTRVSLQNSNDPKKKAKLISIPPTISEEEDEDQEESNERDISQEISSDEIPQKEQKKKIKSPKQKDKVQKPQKKRKSKKDGISSGNSDEEGHRDEEGEEDQKQEYATPTKQQVKQDEITKKRKKTTTIQTDKSKKNSEEINEVEVIQQQQLPIKQKRVYNKKAIKNAEKVEEKILVQENFSIVNEAINEGNSAENGSCEINIDQPISILVELISDTQSESIQNQSTQNQQQQHEHNPIDKRRDSYDSLDSIIQSIKEVKQEEQVEEEDIEEEDENEDYSYNSNIIEDIDDEEDDDGDDNNDFGQAKKTLDNYNLQQQNKIQQQSDQQIQVVRIHKLIKHAPNPMMKHQRIGSANPQQQGFQANQLQATFTVEMFDGSIKAVPSQFLLNHNPRLLAEYLLSNLLLN